MSHGIEVENPRPNHDHETRTGHIRPVVSSGEPYSHDPA